MPTNNTSDAKIFSPSVRKRKAYYTAFRVFMSYLWLKIKSKFLGKNYFDRKINQLHLKNADLIKERVQELQGLFIKFGQLISNLSNVLPEEFRAPLEELQDHIQAKPYYEIEQTIKEQLGKLPEEIFTDFTKEPLAAASIGQVHRAKLNGEEVVVKIQHRNIDSIAKADLTILKNLVKLHGFFMHMEGLEHTYEQVKLMIQEELDYKKEIQAMQKISDNLQEVPELRITIPKVYHQHSTSKILVASYCEGTNIGHLKEIKSWGVDLEDLAKRLLELYCKMILIDGFYHADPHPGNILVNKEGEIILLDFGAVAHLSEATKKAIPELIEAVVRNDTTDTVAALRKMGFLGSDKNSKAYVEKLIDIFKEFLQNEVQLDGLNFQNIQLNSGLSSIASIIRKVDLREVSNNIRIPKDYILLNRTIVLLLGNAFQLAPKLNILHVIRPYIQKHVLSQEDGLTELIINTFKNQITTAVSIPSDLSRYLKNANEQELEEEVRGVKNAIQKIYFLGQQFLYSFILVALVYFLNSASIPQTNFVHNIHLGLIIFFSFLLVRAFWRDGKVK